MKEIKNIKVILVMILLLFALNNIGIAQDCPFVIVKTTTIQVENDTLWVLNHNQYMNCIRNTILLDSANKVILLYKENEIEYDSIIKCYEQDIKILEDIYFATLNEVNKCKNRKRQWRTTAIVAVSAALLENLIIIYK